uniref:Zn(2)-C6 fungal-type domain-containing protein n=1 Tax=Ganoderma boninense TaxID=34458 RepID=A0A5K1JW46_9APHY|nr:Zn(2)-C6 fungal-type domain-containing protein [Ganoderma boninense]
MSDHKHIIRLQAAMGEYDWGRQGSSSLAARLGPNAVGPTFRVDEGKCYGEMCVGTHHNGPLTAHLFDSPSRSLLDLISTDTKAYLGEKLSDTPSSTTRIPYCIRILSIRKMAPLQAHPDLKGLAGQLRQSAPDSFIDASFHKPQIAIALGEPLCITRAQYKGEGRATVGHAEVDDPDTAFMGFVGFRPLEEIKAFLEKIPELVAAIDEPALVIKFTQSPSNELLKQVYAKLLNRGAEAREEVAAVVKKLQERMMQNGAYVLGSRESEFLFRLFMKVNAQYPGDVGVLATTFFMNFAKLRKGEALYIGADEVYAYMEGDIIECKAISEPENVASATTEDSPPPLTTQVRSSISLLTFTSRPTSHWALPAQRYSQGRQHRSVKYGPPSEDYVVVGTFLSTLKAKEEVLEPILTPTIGIVIRGKVRVSASSKKRGECLDLDEGSVIFVPPGNEIRVEVLEGKGQEGAGELWWAQWSA